jgi:hypothetical protein
VDKRNSLTKSSTISGESEGEYASKRLLLVLHDYWPGIKIAMDEIKFAARVSREPVI